MSPAFIPLAHMQRMPAVMVVEPGVEGGRLAFVRGSDHEVIADFASCSEANEARAAANECIAAFWASVNHREG